MLENVGIAVLHPYIRKRWQTPSIPLKANQRSSLVVNFPRVFLFSTQFTGFHRVLSGLEIELQRGERQPLEAYTALLEILRGACADEVAHKEDAAKRAAKELQSRSGVSGIMDSLQFSAVYWASRVGAAIAKHVWSGWKLGQKTKNCGCRWKGQLAF